MFFKKVYKVDRPTISQVLIDILELRNVKIEDNELLIEALKIYSNKNLDFVDCLLCAYSKKYKVVSFDKGVKKCTNALTIE
ncbi:PIN domain-containing protein [Aquifex aeolicus]|uniref:PIN domain-containing protein n=1 Tax=Aquifex aeolicus TaxID=63363 RepID=UPI0002EC742D|nr:PIN domain-containing protein [Aquifex aeolicus]